MKRRRYDISSMQVMSDLGSAGQAQDYIQDLERLYLIPRKRSLRLAVPPCKPSFKRVDI